MNRILVVDDSLSVRKALEKILTTHAEVSVAIHAEDALAQIHGGLLPQLVITDVLMPGMSGFELARELRLLTQTLGTPVVLISGIIDDDVHRQVHEVGAFAVVRKPFTAEELLPVIWRALGDVSAEDPAEDTATAEPEPEQPYDPELISEPRPTPGARVPATLPVTATPSSDAPSAEQHSAEQFRAAQCSADAVPMSTPVSTPGTPPILAALPASVQALPETPQPPRTDFAASTSAAQALVDTLTQKPGVLGALVTTREGSAAEQSGDLRLAPADLAMYARFFASTASTLGSRLQGGASNGGVSTGVQLEFEGRTLLILPYGEAHLLVCLLTDANSSSMVRFTVRRQSAPLLV